MQNILSNSIQNLIEEAGIETMSPEAKEFVMEQLGEQIFQRVLIQMAEDLSDEKVSAFLEFISNDNSDESVETYLRAVYPNLKEVIESKAKEVLEEYKEESLTTV